MTLREITNDEIAGFGYKKRALDFGFATDPLVYHEMAFDKKHRKLFIYEEICRTRLSNAAAVEQILTLNKHNDLVRADSAEQRTISELKGLGLNIRGVKKGPDSVRHGIKFLQDLFEIVIDKRRCPNAAFEFSAYEVKRDARGELMADFHDANNHSSDTARYGLEEEILGPTFSFR